jgi:hypothetical protein
LTVQTNSIHTKIRKRNKMGTRGLTKVIKNDRVVVAQYGQWDHYPSGQGLTALNFLRDEANVDKLDKGLYWLYEVNDQDVEETYERTGENFQTAYPSLVRDTGAVILELIANAKGVIPVLLNTDFEKDELFCEGVFTVNLDDKTFITKHDGIETVMPLDSLRALSDEMYLEQTRCPVHAFHKTQTAVA